MSRSFDNRFGLVNIFMDATFSLIDKHVYQIDATMPIPLDDVVEELNERSWILSQPIPDGTFDISYVYPGESSPPNMKKIEHWIFSYEFKQQMIDTLYDNEHWRELYPCYEKEWLYHHSEIFMSWGKTPARQNRAPMHVDGNDGNQNAVFGMIYLIDENDPARSTHFSRYGTGKNGPTYPIVTGYGKGWLTINSNQCWHKAMNDSDEPRYHLRIRLAINDSSHATFS